MRLLLRRERRVDRPGIGIGVGAHGIRPDPQPVLEVPNHQLAGDHADRAGDRARIGHDRVGAHRDVVAARGGDRTHRRHHRLAAFAGPFHLAPDGLRCGDRAPGTVHPQHYRGHRIVGGGLPQCRRDGVTTGGRSAERQKLRPTTSVDDRAVDGDHGERRLGAAAGNRRHGWRQPRPGRTGVARQVEPRRSLCRLKHSSTPISSAIRAYASSRNPIRSTRPEATASSRNSGARSANRVERAGIDVAGFGDRLPHLALQAFQHPGDGLAVGVGEAVLGEKVCRRLVFASRDDLGFDPRLVERVAQERGVAGEADQPDASRGLHPDLTERRGQVVGQRARIGLGPGQRRLDGAESRDRLAQLLNRRRRRRRRLHAGDQPGDPRVLGGAVDRGDGVAQRHRPATPGDDRQRVKARRLRRHRAQVEFEHAAVGYAVVAGGVDPVGQGADVVDAGNRGQEGEHICSVPTGRRTVVE